MNPATAPFHAAALQCNREAHHAWKSTLIVNSEGRKAIHPTQRVQMALNVQFSYEYI